VNTRRPIVERALGHPRGALTVLLVGLPLACWIWVIAMARDMYGPMTGPSAWMMRATWDAPYLLLLWAMWAAMMAGMMLPSATPVILLAARPVGRPGVDASLAAARLDALVGGYLAVWALFSAGATALQFALARSNLLTIMMEPASSSVMAALLLVAGLYQLTPLKEACLRSCRSPLAVLMSADGSAAAGAFRAGLRHGIYCLGCCWALMLVLFAGGVMNLFVILALTVWVAVEKIAPFGQQSARISGALLVLWAGWVFFR
jgi:predicted metal-binding membrane protein